MKRIWMLLCLAAVCATGCHLFDDPDDGTIQPGMLYYTDCPVVFYFVDEDGADLVDVNQASTYPLAYRYAAGSDIREMALLSLQTLAKDGVVLYYYNDACNWFVEDLDEHLCRFQTYLWGVTPETEYNMFVYAGSRAEAESLKVKYGYVFPEEGKNLGRATWGVEVKSLTYNGVEVFQGNENGKVFVVKPSHGETTVKTGSLQ